MLETKWSEPRDRGDTLLFFGDNLFDVSTFLAHRPRVWKQESSRARNGSSWDLGADWEETLRLARDGWQQGIADLDAAVRGIEPEKFIQEEKWDVAGYRVDVGRFLAGNPDSMATRGRNTRQKPLIHLVVNASGHAGIAAKTFAAYGAALTAVIDKIENSGRRVEVDVVYTAARLTGDNCCIAGWKVKAAEDHCDLSALAFSLAHPAAYRRLAFALWERSPASWEHYGYGGPRAIGERDLIHMGCPDAFILPGVSEVPGNANLQEMTKACVEQINRAAGEEIVDAT